MTSRAPISVWVVDDTGCPRKGKHSIGIARQYCGQVGKQDNCKVAVSLSISTVSASLPIAYELYLPETWSEDPCSASTSFSGQRQLFLPVFLMFDCAEDCH